MRWIRGFGLVPALSIAGCTSSDSLAPDFGLTEPPAQELSAARTPVGVPGSVKVYCISEASCFALAYEFTDNRDDALLGQSTTFSVYVQNLQGTYPNDGTSPFSINRFRFLFFDTQESPEFVDAYPVEEISAVGNVQPGINNQWSNDAPIAGLNRDVFFADPGSGILGCDVNSGSPDLWFTYRTCPRDGLNGWVRVDFILWRSGFEARKAPVRLKDFELWIGNGFSAGHYCVIGGPQVETCTVLAYNKAVSP